VRWLFIGFLLLNIVYLGWELDRQFHIDRHNTEVATPPSPSATTLKLLDEGATKPRMRQPAITADSGNGSLFVQPGDQQLATELPEMTTVGLAADTGNYYCYTFGPIEEDALAVGISDWFNSRRATTHVRFSDERGRQLFWVYLAPKATGDDTMNIMTDLKSKGIVDYRLIDKGEIRNAISLGLYSGRESLNSRLGELKQQGYQPVVVPYEDGKRVYWVDVRLSMNPEALAMVFKGYPSRYHYVPVDCGKAGILANAQ